MHDSDKFSKIFKTIGDNVRCKRKELKLTQVQVAELLNCHKRYYQRIESGQASITVVTLQKIAEALKTPIDNLLQESASSVKAETFKDDDISTPENKAK